MKKFFILPLLWVVFFSFDVNAQDIPVDSDIRIGHLDNGLKYYIKHNEKPEDKVEMYIALNAGSILEDDDQQGLAHFMEHMNFNGTKHFPDNKLVDFLQSIGIKFGQHLNAYTSFDETVYMLPVPLDKPENLDSGLLVLEDWAFNALLTDEQIDKERGVVLEELRLGLGPDQRMRDRYLPKMLYKSHYSERLPIGKKELLETFSYDKIRRFHKEWYRPNLMAVVIVGDIDVNEIEQKIKANFSKYENPAGARERMKFNIPNHEETLVAIETDPDATFSRVEIMYKDQDDFTPDVTIADYDQTLVGNVYSRMMRNRIQELINSNNPPFTYGSVGYGGLGIRPKHALSGSAMTKPGGQLSALEVLINEIERAKRFGFTQGELDRAKAQILSNYETSYKDRDKTESRRYVMEYVRNFLQGEPIPGIAWEFNHFKEVAPGISLAQVNAFAKEKVNANNRVVVITGPEKEDVTYPTEAEVLALFDESRFSALKPYEDKEVIKNLVHPFRKRGKVKSTEKDAKLGTTTWTLSNGVKVTFKKTDFKDDEILFKAVSLGGNSVLSDADFLDSQFAFGGLSDAGVNSFSKTDIQKYLQGKQVRVRPSIGELSESLSGSATPKDLGTMMEMIYAYFTGLNFDEASFNAYKEKQSGFLGTILSNPQFYFSNEFAKFVNANNPRFSNIIPLEEDWARTNYKKAYDVYKEKFADADDFHFYFVGSIDEAQLKAYVEQYVATLPVKKSSEKYKDDGYKPIAGSHKPVFKKGKDPKSMVMITMYGDADYNIKEDLALQALGDIATIKVIEKLREEESGIYGGGAYGSMSKAPVGEFSFMLQFPCGPENVESLTQNALDELQKLIDNGPEEKDLDKFKKGAINDLNTDVKTNKYWLKNMTENYVEGGDPYAFLNTEAMVNALTVDDIKNVAQKYLTGDKVIATLMPEDGWEANTKKEEVKKSADLSPQQVIDNYFKALGGKDKLEAVTSIVMDNTSKVMGMEVKGVTKMMANPYRFYTKQSVMGQETVQVFDGEKGMLSQAGQQMEMPAAMLDALKNKRLFDVLAYKAEDYNGVEIVELDGKTYNLLTKDEEQLYFDAQTGLLYKTKNAQGEAVITEYTTVNGIQYPAKMTQSAQGMNVEVENTNVRFNTGVSAEDFKF